MTPGEYLRETRENSGLTMGQLGRELGYSVPYICDIELGRRAVPRGEARTRWCRFVRADGPRLDELCAVDTGKLDLEDLTPKERERVARFVAGLRAGRAA